MIIKDIYVSGFGKIQNQSFSFGHGINIICGHNEAGKSTLHSFIFHMLYGINRARGRASRFDAYSRYCPWDYPDSFGGSMRIIVNDVPYLIERSFNTSNKSLTVTNELTGKAVYNDEDFLNNLIGGISENAFASTLCISQLGANNGDDLAELLKKKVLNMGATSSFNIDAPHAVKLLTEKKKSLSAGINQEALKAYYETVEQIEAVTFELDKKRSSLGVLPSYSSAQAEELEQENEKLNKDIDNLHTEYELLKKDLKTEGFESLPNVISIETLHNNLWTMAADASQMTLTYNSAANDNAEKSVTSKRSLLTNIIKGSLFGICVAISILLFVADKPLLGVIFLLGAIGLGLFTLISFLPSIKSKTHNMQDNKVAQYSDDKNFSDSTFDANNVTDNNIAANKEIVKKLFDIYQKYLKQPEVNVKNKELFINYISYIKASFDKLEECKSTIDTLKSKISSNQEILLAIKSNTLDNAKLFWETDNLQIKLEALEEERTRLDLVLSENSRLKKEIEAIELAINTIKEISTGMHAEYAPGLNREVTTIFNNITQRNHGELLISENLDITLNSSNRTVPIETLSLGTIEQIYLSLRLAVANILFVKSSFPLMLDEIFAMYDNLRLAQTLKYINNEHKGQTFIFSCQSRERLIAEKLDIPFTIIKL